MPSRLGRRLAPGAPRLEEALTIEGSTPAGTGAQLAVAAARVADDKLGVDTVVIDVGDVLVVTDYFVITSAGNPRQVKAIVEAVEERLAELGARPTRVEGVDRLEWVLMDYGSFVVHVFDDTQRAFYRLDHLWGDRPRLDWRSATLTPIS